WSICLWPANSRSIASSPSTTSPRSIRRHRMRSMAQRSNRCCECRNNSGSGLYQGGSFCQRLRTSKKSLRWQLGVWGRMSPIYLREVDNRFTEVVDGVIRRGALRPGQQVLDLGTGTGSVAVKAASLVSSGENVTALDIGPEMLGIAWRRAAGLGLGNITF